MRYRSRFWCALILVLFAVANSENIEEIRKKCQSAEGLQSCGTCTKMHPDCVWCSEPGVAVPRCDHKSFFARTCPSAVNSAGNSEISMPEQHNHPIGMENPRTKLPIQVYPQQIFMRLKPGESLTSEFTYRHKRSDIKDMYIQTSDYKSFPIDVAFEIDCEGQRIKGKTCQDVKENDEYKFYVTVTLKECNSGAGTQAISVGVSGYNDISAIFVTSICACECEKLKNHQKNSYDCNAAGTLVCGACVCEPGFGGPKCQCDLAKHGASSAKQLDDRCRKNPGETVCSGQGTCECGKCKCTANHILGRYCECDSTSCPKDSEGRLCSGRGECYCGKCRCEEGFDGPDCGCTADEAPCRENGKVCSNNGKCQCGRCACNDGFTGAHCSVEQPSNEKDGTTLNEADFAGTAGTKEEGDILPENDNSPKSDEGVDAGTALEQDTSASGSTQMQVLLALLLVFLTVKVGLILA